MSDNESQEVVDSEQRPYEHLITDTTDLAAFVNQLTLNETNIKTNASNLRTGLVYSEEMSEHRCLWDDNYEENPKRFTQTLKRFKELELIDRCLALTVG
ncbi:unnamed protein product [Medioppia subpectinata]|uniref:Uncharacterized protein n=1 Tax=Medioppia subpectinata TaxID=1979941 RepID=A0A7R9LF28_9ACAR|nr:unnamed protein product [Medioppia subpectinata]CAG2118287.1 unnamed protein product [Medioppia subpectinata]